MNAQIINKPNHNNPQIIILPELRDLIRPLSKLEYEQLEENIREEGIRDMLILWKRGQEHILVDGHNRFSISQKYGLDFLYVEREFENIEKVKEWMIDNQLGKRNLTENEISYLRGLQYRQMKNTHGGDRKTEISKAHNEPLNETGIESFKHTELKTTAKKLAETHKVSENTIKRDEQFADALDKVSVLGSSTLRNKILSKEIDIPKKKLLEIAELPMVEIIDIAEGLEQGKPLSDLLPKTKPMEQPLPEEAETKFAKFLNEVKTPKETEIERNIYNHLLKVGENTFTNLVKVFGATENILTKMINEKRLLSRRSTGMLDKIYRVNPANTTKQIPETPKFPEISEAAEVDWKDGYYKCKAEEYQTTIYIDCANENFQMVEEDSMNQRYKIIAPFKEEMPRFSNFTEITSAEYREVFQAALKYFGVHHQEAKPIIPEKDKFTEEDYKNKELQKEFFGLYAEMPVQFQKDYVAIPRNQYKYFRGFISFVCQKRKEEVEEVKKNYDDFQKQIEELQQKNRWCFAGYDRFKLFNAGFKIYRCESTRYEENPQYIIKEFSDIGSWKNKSKHKTKADWKRAIEELLKDEKSVCETYPE
jgi:hypothetical protein